MLCVMLKSTENLFYVSFYCANFEIKPFLEFHKIPLENKIKM